MNNTLPTGTVTFLFTDIQGSVPLWERKPEKMAEALQIHNTALRQAIEANRGVVFKTVGDAFQAAFPTALQALKAAIDGQRGLQSAAWNELGPLKVRMGLHTGEAELDPSGDEYAVSPTKNRIGRIHSAAHGDQILLSQETANLVERELPESIALKDLGEHQLRGMAHHEHLFQVITPDLPVSFPPLATIITHPHNLPPQLTSFIGREMDLVAVCERMRDPAVRLLTLTGVGGTGKTRLSISIGLDLLEDYPDGVFFVNLAPVREPALVLNTIAQVFSLHETPAMTLTEVLKDYLAKKHLLLILDNFEQVIEAGPDVLDLLVSALKIKMLVTSRALLRLSGEVDYPLQPLDLPSSLTLEALVENESLLLFVERARAVSPGFHLTAENAPLVAEICRRLDGLPLAIELAAPRLRLLSPIQMLHQLNRSLDLLVGGTRDVPARHQTMRAAIEWSYTLLSEKEKSLFRRLGVFAGGCTLAAATALCGESDADNLDEKIDVMSGIESLLDQNLLRRSEHGGEARFWMYETIREYAQEQLECSVENRTVHQAFARYFTDAKFRQDFNQMELEIDNLRAVLRWSIDSGDVAPGLILGWEFEFWMAHTAEARRWLKELLASPASQAVKERSDAIYGLASLAYFNGDLAESIRLFREYEDLIEQSPDREDLLDFFRYVRGMLEAAQDHYDRAILELQEFCRWGEKRGKNFYIQAGLSAWASYELVIGHVAKARELLLAATEVPVETKLGRYNLYERKAELGWCDLEEDKLSEAEQRFKEGMINAKESGYRLMYNFCLKGLAATALKRRQLEQSARLYGATEQVSILLGHTTLIPGWEAMHQRYFASLRAQIDPQIFDRAWQEGRNMGLVEALAYALET